MATKADGKKGDTQGAPGESTRRGILAREGEYWTLACGDSVVRLRDSKGLRYLAALLAHPGVELAALDLASADDRGRLAAPRSDAAAAGAEDLDLTGGLGDAGEALDEAAKAAYKQRLEELRDDLAEAESFNDTERAAGAREEMDFLAQELAGAVGLGGRNRRSASAAERARVNITRAIKATIGKVAENDNALGHHLASTVKTGAFCSYRPAGGLEIVVGEAVHDATAQGVDLSAADAFVDLHAGAARRESATSEPPGRALRTLLFTEIVGSADQMARIGDRAWRELLERHDALVRDQVAGCGGRVVTKSGEGFFVSFDGPGPAIACAEAACTAVRRLGIEIRAGVHTGECELLGETLVGMAVHIAERVSALAGPGEILVSGTVRELVAGSDIELSDRGTHALRGVPGEWRIFALQGVQAAPPASTASGEAGRATDLSIPLPPRLGVAAHIALFGRTRELDELDSALAHARGGKQQAVLLAGEPGIGKTRLAAELAARAHSSGADVLYGRSDADLGIPYQPFVEALAHYVEHAPADLLSNHRAAHGDEVARLVPQLAKQRDAHEPRTTGAAQTDRYRLFAAVADLLAGAAVQRPLVIVLDDLHWADKPSLLLFKYLVTSPAPMGALVIGTYRSTELVPEHPLAELLADLRREPGVARLSLGGLDHDGVIGIAEEITGGRLGAGGAELAHALHEETNGNPFFVGEILRHLSESDDIERAGRRWREGNGEAGLELPGSIRETIARRVTGLGDRTQRVLATASVIGRDFELELLAGALKEDVDDVLDALDVAVRSALIAEAPGVGPRYTFAHALVVHTLYEQLGAGRRRRTHRLVAAALEELCGGEPGARIGQLAHHAYEGATTTDPSTALRYAREAGDHALSQLAPDEAVRWYGRALELQEHAPDDAQRCELLIGLGTAQNYSGDAAFRETLLEAAELAARLGDSDRLARAALANTRGFVSGSGEVDDERVATLEAALAAIGPDDSDTRARLLATLASEIVYTGDWERRLALSDEALDLARRLGEQGTLRDVLSARFMTIWAPPTLGERTANTEEDLALAASSDDPMAEFWAIHWRIAVCGESGEPLDKVVRLVEREAQLAHRLRQPTARWLAMFDRAALALMRGLHEEAESWADEAGQIGTDSGQPEAIAFYVGQLLNIRFEQGRMVELEPLIAEQVEANPGIPGFRAALALARCDGGLDDEAREVLEVDVANSFGSFLYDPSWLVSLAIFAEAAARLEHEGAAAALYPLLEPWEDLVAFNYATAWGSIARHLGNLAALLGRHELAERHLQRAAEVHERVGAPIWLARTRLDLARLKLARDGGDQETASLAEQALATAKDLGCGEIERAATALLEAAR
jgi:class 3 adenylate cyclase